MIEDEQFTACLRGPQEGLFVCCDIATPKAWETRVGGGGIRVVVHGHFFTPCSKEASPCASERKEFNTPGENSA